MTLCNVLLLYRCESGEFDARHLHVHVGYLYNVACTCMSLNMEFGVFGGLIIPAFSLILSLNSPVYMLASLCFALVCIHVWVISSSAS